MEFVSRDKIQKLACLQSYKHMADKIDPNSIQKKFILLQNFDYFRMKYIIERGCLYDDCYI